jgi:hypothetical protein
MNVKQQLHDARALLATHGKADGVYVSFDGCLCSIGALMAAEGFKPRNGPPSTWRSDAANYIHPAMLHLAKAINPSATGLTAFEFIADFSDNNTIDVVLAMFDAAEASAPDAGLSASGTPDA